MMNLVNYIRLLVFSLCILPGAFISAQNENILNGPKALPNGKIVFSSNYYIEFVFHVNDTSHVYLFDSNSKPLSNIAITGKIVFQHYDSTISSFDLVQYKETQFIVKTHFPSYKRCNVYFEINGASVFARFQQDEEIAATTK
jgi:hypothetical protein